MDQKDVKDIKAKADGPGNLKSWRAKKDVKDIKAKANGPKDETIIIWTKS